MKINNPNTTFTISITEISSVSKWHNSCLVNGNTSLFENGFSRSWRHDILEASLINSNFVNKSWNFGVNLQLHSHGFWLKNILCRLGFFAKALYNGNTEIWKRYTWLVQHQPLRPKLLTFEMRFPWRFNSLKLFKYSLFSKISIDSIELLFK